MPERDRSPRPSFIPSIPVPMATCRACGHGYPIADPSPGCASPAAVPVSTLRDDGRCEPCYRRNVTAETAGAVNQKFGSDVRPLG